jgi:hypothetical protein
VLTTTFGIVGVTGFAGGWAAGQTVYGASEPSEIDHLVVQGECIYFWHRVSNGIISNGALEVWPKEPLFAQ